MTMMPGVAGHAQNQSRQQAEEYFGSAASLTDVASLRRDLYMRERAVRFEMGTVALYQLGVWHRGTPVTTVRSPVRPQSCMIAFADVSFIWMGSDPTRLYHIMQGTSLAD